MSFQIGVAGTGFIGEIHHSCLENIQRVEVAEISCERQSEEDQIIPSV